MAQKTALLIGGSGLIGGHCLNYLLNDDDYSQVEVLVRRPIAIDHPKLVQHQVDFHQLSQGLKTIHVHDVFCCLGTTIKKAGSKKAFYEVDFTYPFEIAKLSQANGAEQFMIVTALGANQNSAIFYNQVKGEIEQAISLLGFKGIHIFRPSLLLGERQERRPLEEMAQRAFQLLSFGMIGPLNKYKAIAGKAVAFSMVKIAREQRQGKQIFESRQIQTIFDQQRD